MTENILEIRNLSVAYEVENDSIPAVNSINLTLKEKESLSIIGESGSGKSTLALSILDLQDKNAKVTGDIYFKGKNLMELDKKARRNLNGDKIAIIMQNSLDSLNPLTKVGDQIIEGLIEKKIMSKADAKKRGLELVKMAGLKEEIVNYYPHQLSGGMRQRILIAMALAMEPELLIADELTSALDLKSKREILRLLESLKEKLGFSLIVISHDFETAEALTDKIAVIYLGYLMEYGNTKEIMNEPRHTYTRALINSSPSMNIYKDLWGIPESLREFSDKGCPYYSRCNQALDTCKEEKPDMFLSEDNRLIFCHRHGIVSILKTEKLSKTYVSGKEKVEACKNINLEVFSGEIVGLIGKSGSGKSTVAECIIGSVEKDRGNIYYLDEKEDEYCYSRVEEGISMVYQDPFSAINDQFTVLQAITESLVIIRGGDFSDYRKEAEEYLKLVYLPNDEKFLARKVKSLSGGQRQRLAIGRSLITRPKLLIADEITAMLDASTSANILRLLKELQTSRGFSCLYISHDLDSCLKICDEIYLMRDGKIENHLKTSKLSKMTNHAHERIIYEDGLLEEVNVI